MSERNDGGPAFPVEMTYTSDGAHGKQTGHASGWETGMSLRDYFAAQMQEDDRLVKCVRAMDDEDLAIFAVHPDLEREDWLADVEYHGLDAVEKITKRLQLEAKAIARVRYMQADAMLAERENQ